MTDLQRLAGLTRLKKKTNYAWNAYKAGIGSFEDFHRWATNYDKFFTTTLYNSFNQ